MAALGIDLSTHGVHMALVDRDGIVETATVRLDGHGAASQVSMLRGALIEMPCPVDTLALIEQPYHGHDNPQTTIALARVAGMVRSTRVAFWGTFAGSPRSSGRGAGTTPGRTAAWR